MQICFGDIFSKTIISFALVGFETSQLGATCIQNKRVELTKLRTDSLDEGNCNVKPIFRFMYVSQNHNSFLQISCYAVRIVNERITFILRRSILHFNQSIPYWQSTFQRYVWVSDWFKCTSPREIVTRQQQIAHSVLSRHQYGILQGTSHGRPIKGAFLWENEIASKEPKNRCLDHSYSGFFSSYNPSNLG